MNEGKRLQRYFADQSDVMLVYLFGSRASGQAAPESDYDFAVLTRPPISYARRFEMASELCRLLNGAAVEVVLLQEAPVELAYAVIATGNRLYERDIAARVEFEAGVLSRYGDMIHMLREQRDDLVRGGKHEAGIRRNRAALKQTERVLAEIRAAARSRAQ